MELNMKYRVIKEYSDIPQNPIKIIKNEVFKFIEESDPKGDWPNWIFCKGKNKEGWIPKQILKIKGTHVTSLEYYFAKEHILIKNEIIVSEKELNGWVWGIKKSNPDILGWAPLNHLQKL